MKTTNEIKSFIVKNDTAVKLVLTPIEKSNTTSIGILVGSGSITEDTSNTLGYSHFLEHMVFKGTSLYNAEKINKMFEKMGAYVNAFTGKYYTLFYIHCLSNYAQECLKLLLEIIFEAQLLALDIEKEKQVILEEIATYKDSPEEFLYEEFYKKTFQNSFLGRAILGNESVINNITEASLKDYYKKMYVPENTLVSIAGAFNPHEIKNTIEYYFHDKPINNHEFISKGAVAFRLGHQTYHKPELEQSYVALGIKGDSLNLSKHALKLFNIILGGMSSSRLYLAVRERKALCYSIDSTAYTDPNIVFLNIFASSQNHHLKEMLHEIISVSTSFYKKPISNEELLIAKNQLKSKILFRQESISQLMMKAASQVFFYGKPISDNWLIEKINNISLKDFDPLYHSFTPENISIHLLSSTSENIIQTLNL